MPAAGWTCRSPAPGASVVERGGAPVAMLMHAPSSVADPEGLAPLIGAAALALENARLQVDLQTRLEEQAALQRVATLVAQLRPADVGVRRRDGGDRPPARRAHRQHGAVRRAAPSRR